MCDQLSNDIVACKGFYSLIRIPPGTKSVILSEGTPCSSKIVYDTTIPKISPDCSWECRDGYCGKYFFEQLL